MVVSPACRTSARVESADPPFVALDPPAGRPRSTVGEMGWSSVKNGALLALGAEAFEMLVTLGQKLARQQWLQTPAHFRRGPCRHGTTPGASGAGLDGLGEVPW